MYRSIRFRMAAWYTAIVVLTFVLAAVVISRVLYNTLSENLDQSLTGEAKWVAEHFEKVNDSTVTPKRIYNDIFDHAAYYFVKEYIEVYDSAGMPFYRSFNLERDTLRNLVPPPLFGQMTLTSLEKFRDHNIRVATFRNGTGTIYVGMPTYSVSAPVTHLLEVLAWLIPFVALLSIGGGFYVANKTLYKVNSVIEAAKTITVERLHDRIPEQEVQDEIGRLISTFNEMIARLDYSFNQMRQFTADASHELRTPLAVLRAQLESVMTNKVSMNEMLETIANCLDETMHMSMLVEHLLLLAKADVGRDFIQKVPIDLGQMLCDIHDESVILASHRSIEVKLQRTDTVTILGDAQRLRQMLLNLIDNAIKYNHPNGLITLGVQAQDGMAVLKIADSGIGIPEEELPKIFDRFYRVDKARTKSSGGVGLGLSIVRWTVEAHGGRITVASELNKGTTFTIYFPLAHG